MTAVVSLSWVVAGVREVERALRGRQVELAWALGRFVARRAGLPLHELLSRAWCRAIGVEYRRSCSVGGCCRPALHGAAWCEECWPVREWRHAG
jgi:hypothetical protein